MTRIDRVVIVPQRLCVVSEQQICCFYLPDIQVEHCEECQTWEEIKKTDPKQVHMALFGLIFIQDGSIRLWDASQALTPAWKINKINVVRLFQHFQAFPRTFLSSLLQALEGHRAF